jgi:hypothetical protein
MKEPKIKAVEEHFTFSLLNCAIAIAFQHSLFGYLGTKSSSAMARV